MDENSNKTEGQFDQDQVEGDVEKRDGEEYAKKPSFLSVYKGKIIAGSLLFIFLIVVAVVGLSFFQANVDNGPSDEVNPSVTPTPTPLLTKPESQRLIAYIKDRKGVWVYTTDDKIKRNIVSVPSENETTDEITDLTWKRDNEVTYAYCSDSRDRNLRGCTVYTYNVDTNSEIVEEKLEAAKKITALDWSDDLEYMTLIAEEAEETKFYVRSGSLLRIFNRFLRETDRTGTVSKSFVTPDSKYAVFHAVKREEIIYDRKPRKDEPLFRTYPSIEIFRMDGAKVEQLEDKTGEKEFRDPFLVNSETIGYRVDKTIYYKQIGEDKSTIVTESGGLTPILSPDKTQVAFWNDVADGLRNVILQVYDTDLGIRRDILRGIILPRWLTSNKIIAIKSESCLSEDCLLFEFQTATLLMVDTNTQEVTIIDQGASIRNPAARDPIGDAPGAVDDNSSLEIINSQESENAKE